MQNETGWINSWRSKYIITHQKLKKLVTAVRLHSKRREPTCYTLRTFPKLLYHKCVGMARSVTCPVKEYR
jgi:hypothetical protein